MDEAIDFLLQSIEEIIASGEQLPDELIDEIIEILIGYAEELSNQEPITGTGQVPQPPTGGDQVPPAPHPSSNIHSFGYDEKNGNLMVKFQGDYPQDNGSVYSYSGVPKNIFDLFKVGAIPARTNGKNAWGRWWKGKVPSLGASLYTLIKTQGYPYKKVG